MFHLIKCLVLIVGLCCVSAVSASVVVRQEKVVVVDGVKERWQLRWLDTPHSFCGPDEVDLAITCPCSGFAYGQYGRLQLVRMRPGKTDEVLDLGKYVEQWGDLDSGDAALQLKVLQENDFSFASGELEEVSEKEVASRPNVDVMQFFDYDHDGRATEFLFQVGNLPCGKHQMIAVGISKLESGLHVFSSVQDPNEPLVLSSWIWNAMKTTGKPQRLSAWACGDHGSEVQSTMTVGAADGRINAVLSKRQCAESELRSAPYDATPAQPR